MLDGVRHVLRLDEDLSGFYAQVLADEELSWASTGAGRMMRSQTVFEDVVKTICTTNCAWSGTVRMVNGLVDGLGEAAVGGGHAFPTPAAMAGASDAFYADDGARGLPRAVPARAGRRRGVRRARPRGARSGAARGAARRGARGAAAGARGRRPLRGGAHHDADGPPLAAVLDSWTRPTYAKLRGRKQSDKQILRRFKRYGDHAGLAFWLTLTRPWVAD